VTTSVSQEVKHINCGSEFRDSSSSRSQSCRCKNQKQVKSQSEGSSRGCTSDGRYNT
jgi:hypothetical protein